jgi:hypothetical protein
MSMPSEKLALERIRPHITPTFEAYQSSQFSGESFGTLPLSPMALRPTLPTILMKAHPRSLSKTQQSWRTAIDRAYPVRGKPLKFLNLQILSATRAKPARINQKLLPELDSVAHTAVHRESISTGMTDLGSSGMNGVSGGNPLVQPVGRKLDTTGFDLSLVKVEGMDIGMSAMPQTLISKNEDKRIAASSDGEERITVGSAVMRRMKKMAGNIVTGMIKPEHGLESHVVANSGKKPHWESRYFSSTEDSKSHKLAVHKSNRIQSKHHVPRHQSTNAQFKRRAMMWSKEEDGRLRLAVADFNGSQWTQIAYKVNDNLQGTHDGEAGESVSLRRTTCIPSRTAEQCRHRWNRMLKNKDPKEATARASTSSASQSSEAATHVDSKCSGAGSPTSVASRTTVSSEQVTSQRQQLHKRKQQWKSGPWTVTDDDMLVDVVLISNLKKKWLGF